MKVGVVLGAAALLSGAMPIGSAGGQQSGATAAAMRKANYKEIGGAFKTINDELRSSGPDMNSVRPAARDIARRAQAALRQFPRSSAPGPGVVTRARAEIWSSQPAFVKLQNEMIAAATALSAAAGTGDIAAMRSARDTLGGTCKACHDRFREPS